MTTITRVKTSDTISPARLAGSGPLPAPSPVDTTATTRRSRLTLDQVPAAVRDLWSELTPRQRDVLIKYAGLMNSWTDLSDERRDELLAAKAQKYATDAKLAREQAQAARAVEAPSDLESRAELTRMHRAAYVVQCRECDSWRPTRAPSSSRLPSGLCPSCHDRRERDRAKARAERRREASAA